jgi:hypothetical protein
LITTASAKGLALMLRNVIVADPAPMLDTQQLYAADVPLVTFKINTSLAVNKLLVSVNVTLVVAAKEAAFIVMRPAEVFSVTAVALSVS